MTGYTKIPLEKLDEVRLVLRSKLKKLENETGKKYVIRTFYCGPRKASRWGSRPATTLKTDATAAKIGVYRVSNGFRSLIHYV